MGRAISYAGLAIAVIVSVALCTCATELAPCTVRCGSGADPCPSGLVCAGDGYCHEHAADTCSSRDLAGADLSGVDLSGVDLSGADLSGNAPAILSFGPDPSGITEQLLSVWGSSPTDVYVVGVNRTILHSTGNGIWAPQASPVLPDDRINSVWGSSATDVYAVTSRGVILHSAGDGTWAADTTVTSVLRGVWGTSASNVYVVGYDGTVLHSTGDHVWHPQTYGNQESIYFISGTSPTNLFAGGFFGGVRRSTGNGTWSTQTLSTQFSGNAAWSDGTRIWIVGDQTQVVRSNGNDVWDYSSTTSNGAGMLYGIWGPSDQVVYVVGNALVYTTPTSGWTELQVPHPGTLRSIYGFANGEAYVVGDGGTILHGK